MGGDDMLGGASGVEARCGGVDIVLGVGWC